MIILKSKFIEIQWYASIIEQFYINKLLKYFTSLKLSHLSSAAYWLNEFTLYLKITECVN